MNKPKSPNEIAEQWHQAARSKKLDHEKSTQIAFEQCRHYLQALSETLDIERARLRYLAQRLSDYFWAHNEAHRTKETRGYPGHHGCRVRMLHGSLEMHWYYNTFVRVKNGKGHAVFSEHIRRALKHRYSKPAFNRAHDWERPIIEETEAGYEIVRIMNANLTHMRRLVRANLKQLDSLEAHFDGLQPPES